MVLTSNGHVKLIDFGTAKDIFPPGSRGPDSAEMPATKKFVGTPAYMAPEVIASVYSGPEGDLWALGCVLYQVLWRPPIS